VTQHRGKYVAYYRVSTGKQAKSGLGLEAQETAVNDYLNGGSWTMAGRFIETESGKRKDRPELAQALRMCKVHKATLIVAKLDRLARNVAFVSALMESGVKFVALDCREMNKFTIHVLAAVAEHEAALISARTKAALAAAKARGVELGRRDSEIAKYAAEGSLAGAKVRSAQAIEYREQMLPIIEDIQTAGAETLREIAHQLNVRGIPARRGGAWTATQVMRVLA
jgi:DNA invertase Pin-like site-specific DNA recombinase